MTRPVPLRNLKRRAASTQSRKPAVAGDLAELCRQLEQVKQRAEALGIFTDDRELLECPNCGLREASVVRKFFTTAADGKNNFTRFDNRGGKS